MCVSLKGGCRHPPVLTPPFNWPEHMPPTYPAQVWLLAARGCGICRQRLHLPRDQSGALLGCGAGRLVQLQSTQGGTSSSADSFSCNPRRVGQCLCIALPSL